MTYDVSPIIARIIDDKMASGKYASTDELLLDALHLLEAEEQEQQAIQEGLDSLDRGDIGVPLDETFAALRKKHGIRE